MKATGTIKVPTTIVVHSMKWRRGKRYAQLEVVFADCKPITFEVKAGDSIHLDQRLELK